MNRFCTVSAYGEGVFRCKWMNEEMGFLCGRCERGVLGRPELGAVCNNCGARVEEASWPGKKVGR